VFWLLFSVFLIACLGAGATGGLFPPGPWYRALQKPWFNPPDWVFPVTWTLLYLCMSAAGARLALAEGSGLALALWSVQIAFNGLWTPVFFGLKYIRMGLLVVALLWVCVATCVVVFWSVDSTAALLFVPYLIWVSIASALNAAVWRLNPDAARNPPMPVH